MDRIADSAEADDQRRRALAVKDVTKIGEAVMTHKRARALPRKLDRLGFVVASGRHLSRGNHLDSYQRTRHGFRVCVINVSGAWAAWETTGRASGVVASDTVGGACRYK